MKLYGRERDLDKACTECNAPVGLYCAADAGGPQVCPSRAVMDSDKEEEPDADRS